MRSREFHEYFADGATPPSCERFSLRASPHLYVFLHLPKCGGTTIKYYLDAIEESLYVGRLVEFGAWSYRKQEILTRLAAVGGRELRALYGHTTFLGVHEVFPGLEPRYFTALREPVARALSEYRFLLGLGDDTPYGALIRGLMGPAEAPVPFAAWHERFNWWNQMTFYLARMYAGPRVPSWSKSRIDVEPLPTVTQQDFDDARRMLDVCFMVLDADALDRDLVRLLEQMGGPRELATRPLRLNPSREAYELSAADRELIAARNTWDDRLYAHAMALSSASAATGQ